MKIEKTGLKIRKLPIPIGFIIIIFGLVAGIYLINKIQSFKSRASADTAPKMIRITNIDSNSFTVSWFTNGDTKGSLSLSETSSSSPEEIRNDIRDKNSQGNYFAHYISVFDLKPSTKYFFKIISSGSTYDNVGKPFEITTAVKKTPIDSDIAQGRILNSNSQPASGVIVYLSLANTITQAAITDGKGIWMIPLSTARTLDLQDYSNYDRDAQIEEIYVQANNLTANATLTSRSDNPTPDIILGQTYDFTKEMPETTPTLGVINNQLNDSSGFQSLGDNTELSITFPSEKEQVNSITPEFLGNGPKNQKITILVESPQTINDQATINNQGKWNWSPSSSLSPGNHTITVTYTDKNGFLQKVSRSFIVLAADQSNLPSFTATPSGQRTPTPSKSSTPTPTPTATLIPTRILSPTPTSFNGIIVTPTEEPPATGSSLPTGLFFGIGVAAVFVGIALILL